MRFNEAQNYWSDLAQEAGQIVTAADNNPEHPGKFTQEQQERVDAIFAEQAKLENEYPGVTGRKTKQRQPMSSNVGEQSPQSSSSRNAGRIGATYEDLFPEASRDSGGFKSFGEYAGLVNQGVSDSRLMPSVSAATGHTGVGGDGGYMIPTALLGQILNQSLEMEIVRPRARAVPLVYGQAKAPGFDTSDNSSGIGGFSGQWLSEGESMTWQKGLIRSITLSARKLGILTSASNELMADSPFFDSEMLSILSEATAFYLDEAFLVGDGVGKPKGVLNDDALITVAKESGQAADTITFNNLKAMLNRLHPRMNNAVWVASSSAREQLLSLVQYVRNDADSENVGGSWVPAMREGENGWSILGLPVMFSEKVPEVGTTGDIMLADFSQYIVGIGQNATLKTSESHLFDSDEVAFRITARMDGQGRWNSAITPRNGGSTLSWCVALADRA